MLNISLNQIISVACAISAYQALKWNLGLAPLITLQDKVNVFKVISA